MGELVGLVAIVMVFGLPAFIVGQVLRHRERMRALEQGKNPQPKALAAEREELAERVKNLESIVCSVDFELNAKLDRLASRQLAALPPADLSRSDLGETGHWGSAGLRPGEQLAARYRIERALGRGGMGAVYLARDEKLGEAVALKVIAGIGALDPAASERLRREAAAARKISHPNVVRMHDLGGSDGLLFLSMEYVQGHSIAELLRRGPLSPAQARAIALQICDGLQAAHDAGVIHRDLKPANVLIDPQARVKIIDFGLARLAHLEGMTTTGMILGTPEYMAPEQIRGGLVDFRTDLYALGALVYHMVCGRPPFVGENPIAISLSHAQDPVPPPTALRPELAPAWDSFLGQALAKDPAERFASASAMAQALPS